MAARRTAGLITGWYSSAGNGVACCSGRAKRCVSCDTPQQTNRHTTPEPATGPDLPESFDNQRGRVVTAAAPPGQTEQSPHPCGRCRPRSR